MRSVGRDAQIVYLTRIVGLVAAVAAQSILAWQLGPDGRGEYGAGVLFATLLILLFALGQEMANVYYVGSGKLSPSAAFTQSLAFGLFVSAVAAAVGYALTVLVPGRFAAAPVAYYRLALLYIPVAIVRIYLCNLFLALKDTPTYACLTTAPPILLAIGLAFLMLTSLTVSKAILAFVAADGLVALIAAMLLVSKYRCRLVRLEWGALRRSLGYGARFYVGKVFSMVDVQIGTIILTFAVQDAELIGLYASGSAIFCRIWMLAESLQIAMLSRTVSDEAGRPRLVAKVVRMCLAACGVLTLLAFILSKPIICLVLSPAFLAVLFPMWVLLPGILIRVVAKILPAYFAGIDRPQVTSATMGVAVVVNLLLMYLFLPLWGLSGVALSMTIAYCVESLVLSVAFSRISGLPLLALLRFSREDWRTLGTSVNKYLGRKQPPQNVVGG